MNRRHFLTGVAAGVAAALAEPDKHTFQTYGNFEFYPYQRGLVQAMDVGNKEVCLFVARQQGKSVWITEWMSQHAEIDEHGALRLKPEIQERMLRAKTLIDRDARNALLDFA